MKPGFGTKVEEIRKFIQGDFKNLGIKCQVLHRW